MLLIIIWEDYLKNIFTSDHDGCGFKKINNHGLEVLDQIKIFSISVIFLITKKNFNLDKDTGLLGIQSKIL